MKLVPTCIQVYLIAIDACQFHVEYEGGISRYSRLCGVSRSISEIVRDDNLPSISLDHVHESRGKTDDILAYTHQSRHVGSFVEHTRAVALAEVVALRISA